MSNQINFEHVKKNLYNIRQNTQKRTKNREDVLAVFLVILVLVLYRNNMNQEKYTDWYWETIVKHARNCYAGLFQFNYTCINLVPTNNKYSPLFDFPFLLSTFFITLLPAPLNGETMKNISKISKTLSTYQNNHGNHKGLIFSSKYSIFNNM